MGLSIYRQQVMSSGSECPTTHCSQGLSGCDTNLKMPSLPFRSIERKDSRLGWLREFLRDRVRWLDKPVLLRSWRDIPRIFFFLFRLFEIMHPPLYWIKFPSLYLKKHRRRATFV